MANKKFIVKNGLTTQNISFVDNVSNVANTITASMQDTGVLSFVSTNTIASLSSAETGVIFAVNNSTGVPLIETDNLGVTRLSEFGGRVLIGGVTDDETSNLQVLGSIFASNGFIGNVTGSSTSISTPRQIAIDGVIDGSTLFDGTSNVSIQTSANVQNLSNSHYHTSNNITDFLDTANAAIVAKVDKTFVDALAIDANTISNLSSSQFLRSDADDNATGIITFNANVVINDSINFGEVISASLKNNNTLSFDTSNNQLFSISDNVFGTYFAVNNSAAVPSIEVDDDGTIRFAEFDGNILIGTATDDGNNKLQVNGNVSLNTSYQRSIVFANNMANYEPAAGELYWNPDDRTLDLETGGTLLQIGQEEYFLVKNQTGNTITNGQAVMAAGTLGNSGRILATPAVADGTFPSEFFMGIATEDIADGADGFVTQFGAVRQIDTGMFSEGDVLYADPEVPGGLSNTAPIAPNNIITAAIVVSSSNTAGTIFVRPSFRGKLQNSEDVYFNGIQDWDVLHWSTSNSRFEARASNAELLEGQAGSYYLDYSNFTNTPTIYTDSAVDTHLNTGSAANNQVLSWDGADYAWVNQGGGTDYGDSNVDLHLNTASATTDQVLSWNGADYAWVTQSGGGGSSVEVSNTAPSSPSAGDLWFNTDDTTLSVYYSDPDSNQWVVTSGPQGQAGTDGADGADGADAVIQTSNTAPLPANNGDLWFNTDDASLYFYYEDGTSGQYVAVSGPQGPQGEQGPAGEGISTGKAIAMAIVFG